MKIQEFYIGDRKAIITCLPESGEYLDSRVTIEGDTVCWISWPEKDAFIKEVHEVFNKYRI